MSDDIDQRRQEQFAEYMALCKNAGERPYWHFEGWSDLPASRRVHELSMIRLLSNMATTMREQQADGLEWGAF